MNVHVLMEGCRSSGSPWISASPWIQPPVMGSGCALGSEVLGSGSLGSELYSVSFPQPPAYEVWIFLPYFLPAVLTKIASYHPFSP